MLLNPQRLFSSPQRDAKTAQNSGRDWLATLAIDDWLIAPLTDPERRDLLEVVEDRYDRTSTLIATQLPTNAWHEAIGDPTLADAICGVAVASGAVAPPILW